MPRSVVLFVQNKEEAHQEKAREMICLLEEAKIPYTLEISTSSQEMTPVMKHGGQSFHGTARIETLIRLWREEEDEIKNYVPNGLEND